MSDYKKSLYIFLTALLGVLMFVLLDRIAVFFYLYLLAAVYMATSINFFEFMVVDYFILTLVMMLGAWYGIWLGLYWFKKVYEEQSHGGLVEHLTTNYFPQKSFFAGQGDMASLKKRLNTDLSQLEELAASGTAQEFQPEPIKRRIVRKRAPKKLKV